MDNIEGTDTADNDGAAGNDGNEGDTMLGADGKLFKDEGADGICSPVIVWITGTLGAVSVASVMDPDNA